VDGDTRLLIENTAGAGLTIGKTPEEVGGILERVPKALRQRTGYGLDTCHLFAAGHDIRTSRETQALVLDAFEAATGETPGFFHLNDSEFPFGSNKDRHALIGEGGIGVEPFGWLLHDKRSAGIPLILETPQADTEPAVNDDAADLLDVKMITLLRSLAA
jgi:deoxyribonuclease-4